MWPLSLILKRFIRGIINYVLDVHKLRKKHHSCSSYWTHMGFERPWWALAVELGGSKCRTEETQTNIQTRSEHPDSMVTRKNPVRQQTKIINTKEEVQQGGFTVKQYQNDNLIKVKCLYHKVNREGSPHQELLGIIFSCYSRRYLARFCTVTQVVWVKIS